MAAAAAVRREMKGSILARKTRHIIPAALVENEEIFHSNLAWHRLPLPLCEL